MNPANIQEALRMLADGKRFRCGHYTFSIKDNVPMRSRGYGYTWGIIGPLLHHVTDWELIEEPEPEFPFKTWDRCLMRYDESEEWTACKLSHVSGLYFKAVGGYGYDQMTAYSDDILGTDATPETPVWIVKDGKPEVLK